MGVFSNRRVGGGISHSRPGSRRRSAANLTRKARFRPISGNSCQVTLAAGGRRHKITTLANPASFAI
jgi:ribosomal protein L28